MTIERKHIEVVCIWKGVEWRTNWANVHAELRKTGDHGQLKSCLMSHPRRAKTSYVGEGHGDAGEAEPTTPRRKVALPNPAQRGQQPVSREEKALPNPTQMGEAFTTAVAPDS